MFFIHNIRAIEAPRRGEPIALYQTSWDIPLFFMSLKKTVAENLAAAFLAGSWSRRALVERGWQACSHKGRWLWSLVGRVLRAFGDESPRVQPEQLAEFIHNDGGFSRAYQRFSIYPLQRIFWPVQTMAPAPGLPSTSNVPAFTSITQLAEWLSCSPRKFDWYSGRLLNRENAQDAGYPRYHHQWIRKRAGWRLLEKPIFALKQIQRRLLAEILSALPPHEAVHSYRRGRSIASYVQPHAGQRIIIHMDLKDFFPSIRASRIHALFETLGYPRSVARALTGLCTNAVPRCICDKNELENLSPAERWRMWQIYRVPHLPQGAPTSPMLSNLCAFRLDVRLAALVKSLGGHYTRYADDLAFSGGRELERCFRRFHVAVCRIALEEDFTINTRKTRLMRQGVRQQLAGLVLNVHPNIARREYDRLKAILHNCRKHGPDSQNRAGVVDFRAHLMGRVQYLKMINPHKGQKLEQILGKIEWPVGEQN